MEQLKGWYLRIRVSPTLQWLYPLTEFDLMVQPGLTMAGVLQMLDLTSRQVEIRVVGKPCPLDQSVNDGDVLDIVDMTEVRSRGDYE